MEELSESELGTQEYWDTRYKEEIDNFQDHGDPGHIWFGENIVEKIVKWIENTSSITKQSKILDLGCGNGLFLIELFKRGYRNLYGVDYSEPAIKLAKAIAAKENFAIIYSTCNILDGLQSEFDIIHDKGTYDAISLNSDSKTNRVKYVNNVYKSIKEGGFFLITSCNWTKSELDRHFNDYFIGIDEIPTPQFQFGGKTGNVVTSLIYKKKH